MMMEIRNLWNLVRTLEDCAESNDSVGSDYARGKACAFRFAARWLRQECKFSGLEGVETDEKESR